MGRNAPSQPESGLLLDMGSVIFAFTTGQLYWSLWHYRVLKQNWDIIYICIFGGHCHHSAWQLHGWHPGFGSWLEKGCCGFLVRREQSNDVVERFCVSWFLGRTLSDISSVGWWASCPSACSLLSCTFKKHQRKTLQGMFSTVKLTLCHLGSPWFVF